uniref:Uncharacterized protein n=1 Tax=Timema douglasi TaxID=61478 RepID=A0A7R8V9Q3_TIMDO|nr:unnamed protein product [Timema douglasi]
MQYVAATTSLLGLVLLMSSSQGDPVSDPGRSPSVVDVGALVAHQQSPPQDATEEEKRAWQDLQGGWGKRAWQDLQGGWGKRGWQDLQSGWGKRAWQDLHSPWGKRAWRDLGSTWGKRAWQDLQGGWGKRGWQDLQSGWGKRAWQDLQGGWGKRSWDDLRPMWGKRLYDLYRNQLLSDADLEALEDAVEASDEEDDQENAEKRAWRSLGGSWGKRASSDWANFKGYILRKWTHTCMECEWKTILEKNLSAADLDSNIDILIINSIFYCKSSALVHMPTEVGDWPADDGDIGLCRARFLSFFLSLSVASRFLGEARTRMEQLERLMGEEREQVGKTLTHLGEEVDWGPADEEIMVRIPFESTEDGFPLMVSHFTSTLMLVDYL